MEGIGATIFRNRVADISIGEANLNYRAIHPKNRRTNLNDITEDRDGQNTAINSSGKNILAAKVSPRTSKVSREITKQNPTTSSNQIETIDRLILYRVRQNRNEAISDA